MKTSEHPKFSSIIRKKVDVFERTSDTFASANESDNSGCVKKGLSFQGFRLFSNEAFNERPMTSEKVEQKRSSRTENEKDVWS